jgi:hypothetical protein
MIVSWLMNRYGRDFVLEKNILRKGVNHNEHDEHNENLENRGACRPLHLQGGFVQSVAG